MHESQKRISTIVVVASSLSTLASQSHTRWSCRSRNPGLNAQNWNDPRRKRRQLMFERDEYDMYPGKTATIERGRARLKMRNIKEMQTNRT